MKSERTQGRRLIIFSVIYFAVFSIVAVYGTFYDLEFDKIVFNPQSSYAILFEAFSPDVLYAMWGPAFTVLMLMFTRRSFAELLDNIAAPFGLKVKGKDSKAFKTFSKIATLLFIVAFFALSVVGYRKLVANFLKHFVSYSELIYYGISLVIACIFAFGFSKFKTETLRKLEYLSLCAIMTGILFKVFEELKYVTHRIRFREMVAYSNGILTDSGKSSASVKFLHSKLERDMIAGTDFSAYTPWYVVAKPTKIYSSANSFPSGHTFDSCMVFLTYAICTAFDKLKKCAPVMLASSFIYVFATAFSRLVAGAHYLTDVAFGAIIGYAAFLVFYVLIKKVKSKIEGDKI